MNNIKRCCQELHNGINRLVNLSVKSNLVFNLKKTKIMIFPTIQVIRYHELNEVLPSLLITCHNENVEQVKS